MGTHAQSAFTASTCTTGADPMGFGAASRMLLLVFKRGTHRTGRVCSSTDGAKQAKRTRGTRTALSRSQVHQDTSGRVRLTAPMGRVPTLLCCWCCTRAAPSLAGAAGGLGDLNPVPGASSLLLLRSNNKDDVNDLRSHFLSSSSVLTISHSRTLPTAYCGPSNTLSMLCAARAVLP